MQPTGFGTLVDISAYTSFGNSYLAPSDGYIEIDSATTGTTNILVGIGYSQSSFTQLHMTKENTAYSMFVKKGMHIWIAYTTNLSVAVFRPLISS